MMDLWAEFRILDLGQRLGPTLVITETPILSQIRKRTDCIFL